MAVLEEIGPQLGRPLVDTLGGSRHSNMKELRTGVGDHLYRCAFAFDLKRQARVLVGDDKRGKDQERFYADLIKRADELLDAHLVKQRAQIAAEAAKKAMDEPKNRKCKKRRSK